MDRGRFAGVKSWCCDVVFAPTVKVTRWLADRRKRREHDPASGEGNDGRRRLGAEKLDERCIAPGGVLGYLEV